MINSIKYLILLAVVFLSGCALNPKFENQTALNEHTVRVKIAGMARVKNVRESMFDGAWLKYKEMVPDTKATDDDILVRVSTMDGNLFTSSDAFKARYERQLLLVTKEELKADRAVATLRIGDIIDVKFPTWTHDTRTRDRDIRLVGVVCKKSDDECMSTKGRCLGALDPKTGSACDYRP